MCGDLKGTTLAVIGAFGRAADAHCPVFHLFEKINFATRATKPEMFHATRCPFAIGYRPGYVEHIDPAFTQVVKRLAALWIRAVVDHLGDPRRNYGVTVFRGLISSVFAIARSGEGVRAV